MATRRRNSLRPDDPAFISVNCSKERHHITLFVDGRLRLVEHPNHREDLLEDQAFAIMGEYGEKDENRRCLAILRAWRASFGQDMMRAERAYKILPRELRDAATKLSKRKLDSRTMPKWRAPEPKISPSDRLAKALSDVYTRKLKPSPFLKSGTAIGFQPLVNPNTRQVDYLHYMPRPFISIAANFSNVVQLLNLTSRVIQRDAIIFRLWGMRPYPLVEAWSMEKKAIQPGYLIDGKLVWPNEM